MNPIPFLRLALVALALMQSSSVFAQSIYQPVAVGTLAGAGGTSGAVDDTGGLARFNQPWGIAAAAGGRVVVADTLNHTIRSIDANAAVTTVAGVVGSAGYLDGPVAMAQFNRPTGVAVDAAGTVYVADYNNHVIRKISGGVVVTLAGTAGVAGTADGNGTAAQFRNPFGLVLNLDGSVLFVTDQNNQTIRQIALPAGVVTTLAGAAGQVGSVDGPNGAARFNTPRGIAMDAAGTLFVVDAGNLTVRRIEAGGGVSTIAGIVGQAGSADGSLGTSRFSTLQSLSPFGGPCGVAVDLAGNVFVSDQGNQTLRKISPNGTVTTLAGLAQSSGTADGVGNAARFFGPSGVALTSEGKLVVADARNHTIRLMDTLPATPGDSCRPGDTWTARDSVRPWTATASSRDGTLLVAASASDYIYTSTDHGLTWVQQTGSGVHPWWSVAASASGQHLIAAANPGQLYVSHNYGATWTPTESTRPWFTVAISDNGDVITAVAATGQVFTSITSGLTWTPSLFAGSWYGIAMSASGSTQIAAIYGGSIYTSTDSGTSWTSQPSAGVRNWYSVACSANGVDMAAIDYGGQIYLSHTSGSTWTAVQSNNLWRALAMSSDGSQIIAAASNGFIYVSHDSGAHWSAQASQRNWDGLAMSGSGDVFLASDYQGYLYTSDCPNLLTVNCPTNRTVECGTPWRFTPPTATSTCSTNISVVETGTVTNGVCPQIITRTWSVSDGCGNTNQCSQSVTFQDTQPPVLTGITNKSVICGKAWSFDPPIASDLCSGTNVVLRVSGTATNGVCPRTITQTWTAVDACGNSSTFSQTVTLVDNEPPTLSCRTDTLEVPLGTNCTLLIPEIHPPAKDNCTPPDLLVYSQDPAAGSYVDGPCRVVTVSVRDLCGNVARCQVTVCGSDKTPPRLVCPRVVDARDCLVPNVLALVRASDNCTPAGDLVFEQVPAAGTPIAPGVTSVTVTVRDAAGNLTICTVPIDVGSAHSFLGQLFNTGVDAAHAVVPGGSVDLHYTLGPVPANTPTSPGYYHAPDAVVVNSPWGLPPFNVSKWISPGTRSSGYPNGTYTYTNRFVLPPGVDMATVAIAGRWASKDRAQMFLNGLTQPNQVAAITALAPACYTTWTPFSIHGGFLPNPAVNTLYMVVSNASPSFGATALRVEFTEASANCNVCAPPVITAQPISITRPRFGVATMTVSVSGTQPMTYQWYFNGNPLSNGAGVFGADTSTLFIAPLQYANAGSYSVVVSNDCGRIRSKVARLRVTRGFPWIWSWWNAEGPLDPLSPVHGDGLLVSGTPLVGMTRGTCEEFGLPLLSGRSGMVTHVPMLPMDSMIRLPRTGSAGDYSLLMDLLAPPSTNGPTVLFQLPHGSKLQGGGLKLWLTMDHRLRISGVDATGMMVEFSSSVPLKEMAWNRIGLVMSGPQDDGSVPHLRIYLNGQVVAEMAGMFDVPMTGADPGAESGTLFNTSDGNGADLFLAGIQFHETALPPELLAGLGDPDSGELVAMDTTVPPLLNTLQAMRVNGKVVASWSEDSTKLQETTDPVSGMWTDSDLPFTQTEDAMSIHTSVEVDPKAGDPVRYFRLVETH